MKNLIHVPTTLNMSKISADGSHFAACGTNAHCTGNKCDGRIMMLIFSPAMGQTNTSIYRVWNTLSEIYAAHLFHSKA